MEPVGLTIICLGRSSRIYESSPTCDIYMEPMQFDNSEGKSHDTIPYMIINLDYKDQVYIGMDTPVACIKDEEKSCEYLEVNEIVELVKGNNWCPPHNHKIVTSDLVYSSSEVTEFHKVELKDQDVTEETKQSFEDEKCAKWFTLPLHFHLQLHCFGRDLLMLQDTGCTPCSRICLVGRGISVESYL